VLKEEYRRRMFKNRMLRGIFGHKRDEVTLGWRKLHNEKLQMLWPTSNIIHVKEHEMDGAR
jgi:hypothetical protein